MDRYRLIVVSNRQPYEHRWESDQLICTRTDGGLTSALDPVLRRCGGTWVARGSGPVDRDVVGPDICVEVPPESPAYRLHRVWLTPDEIKGGYLGYANQVLWPLCHIALDRINYTESVLAGLPVGESPFCQCGAGGTGSSAWASLDS
jgi:trehalose-6-phosphate synthase